MPRRVKPRSSLLAPAESLIRRLSDADRHIRRRIIRCGLLAMALLFLYSLMSGTYGLPRIVRLKIEKEALIEANRECVVELVDMARVRRMLRSDPAYIERIARMRYHMVRSGETIYRYRGQ